MEMRNSWLPNSEKCVKIWREKCSKDNENKNKNKKNSLCFSRFIMDSCNCLVSPIAFVLWINIVCVDILSIKLTTEKVSNLIGFFSTLSLSTPLARSVWKQNPIDWFVGCIYILMTSHIYLLQIADCAVGARKCSGNAYLINECCIETNDRMQQERMQSIWDDRIQKPVENKQCFSENAKINTFKPFSKSELGFEWRSTSLQIEREK